MKILNLGLDSSILESGSAAARRLAMYGQLTEKYYYITPSRSEARTNLSANLFAMGSGGTNKFIQFYKTRELSAAILAREKFSVISAQDQYYLALIGLSLARKFKIGFEIQVHGLEKFSGVRRCIARYALSRADSIRTVSQRMKKQLMNDFGIAEEKITVVPVFSETQGKAAKTRSTALKSNNEFVFLTIGRLVRVKNIRMQIEAMEKIAKLNPRAELWILGDGPQRKKLESLIGRMNLNDKIKLMGWKNNLDEYLSRADVFLLTSRAEGWGLAVVEAAKNGLPIIMTDVGCAGEVIKNEESGLIIAPGDKPALIDAMDKMIKDGSLRQKLSAGALESVRCLPSREETFSLYKKSWAKAAGRV